MAEIYDACIFFRELDMLETRFHILEDVVDHFVVCEAPETHSGLPKPFYFWENYSRFKRWHKQIIYVRTGSLSAHSLNSWERERYHRSQITRGLKGANPKDWIIVSDVDEIPNPDCVRVLHQLWSAAIVKFELAMYYYDLTHRVKQGWSIGARTWYYEKDPNRIRVSADWDIDHAHPDHYVQFNEGGWHFSYFGGAQQIIDKIDAFMHHGDIAADVPRDPDYITGKVAAGEDLYNRDGFQIERVPLSATLPRYILENEAEYRRKGWITG